MKITADELRPLFLFEHLDDEQLAYLVEHGEVVEYGAGQAICQEGEPAEYFVVMISGEVAIFRHSQGEEVEITRTTQPGVYSGATQAYLMDRIDQVYQGSFRAMAPSRIFRMRAHDFAAAIQEWFPMAIHLLEGLFFGMNATRRLLDQRARLAALGTITAGLTHELNNPAAAVVRSADELGDRIGKTGARLAELAGPGISGDELGALVALRDELVHREVPVRRAMEISDAEDELGDWLEDQGLSDAWDLAPDLVSNGFGIPDGERIAALLGDGRLAPAIRWLANGLELSELQTEISEAAVRISTLLGAAKQYSQMDRAPYQTVKLADLLDSTLTMLGGKIKSGVTVVKEYDPGLPPMQVYAAELNQVWTNLIDNALYAMAGSGTLTVRTSRDGDCALVEIGDTGPGISKENLSQIFTPFFTTKPMGEGTGLGLDISWKIVVNRHHGDLRVESSPEGTRFQIYLPLDDPDSGGR
jgi:signal transduction histidine kinase